MKKIWIISDLDGTLLNSKHELTKNTIKTIKEIEKIENISFAIATGRDYREVRNMIDPYDIKCPIISCNGSALYDEKGNNIYEKFLDDSDFIKLFNYILPLTGNGIVLHIIKDHKWYQVPLNNQTRRWKIEEYIYGVDENFEMTKVTKIFITSETDNIDVLKQIEKYVIDSKMDVNHAFTFEWCLEIFNKEVTKGYALKKLLEHYKETDAHTVAFGDGMNDYEMLSFVNDAYIMKNSHSRLKKILKNIEIIGTNDEESVSNIIKGKYLNENRNI